MQKSPHDTPEQVIIGIDEQIAFYEKMIANLKFTRQMLIERPPERAAFFKENTKITKEIVRTFMRQIGKPMKTVEVIDILYPRADQETKDKAVKTLSVVFNTLEKDGQIKVEKTPGVKGNYYSWIENPDTTIGVLAASGLI